MENNKINIAEILKDSPKGTKLYSPVFGKVELVKINDKECYQIHVKDGSGNIQAFTENGLFKTDYPDAECLLFPSSRMQDWSRFFKRGDMVTKLGIEKYGIFSGWTNDDYTEFITSISCVYPLDNWFTEEVWCTKDTEDKESVSNITAGFVIQSAEAHFKGKYNPETLQVEPVKVECPFKPYDKVLVRDNERQVWRANYFSHYEGDDKELSYVCMDYPYRYCIPYEGNEHLLGTTDPYTEGGSK